jgi:hypothetical protein
MTSDRPWRGDRVQTNPDGDPTDNYMAAATVGTETMFRDRDCTAAAVGRFAHHVLIEMRLAIRRWKTRRRAPNPPIGASPSPELMLELALALPCRQREAVA